jgi:hypothetical protein
MHIHTRTDQAAKRKPVPASNVGFWSNLHGQILVGTDVTVNLFDSIVHQVVVRRGA